MKVSLLLRVCTNFAVFPPQIGPAHHAGPQAPLCRLRLIHQVKEHGGQKRQQEMAVHVRSQKNSEARKILGCLGGPIETDRVHINQRCQILLD